MVKHFLERVEAVDIVERLGWTVHMSTTFFGTNSDECVIDDWEGDVASYRERVRGVPGSGFAGRGRFRASWRSAL